MPANPIAPLSLTAILLVGVIVSLYLRGLRRPRLTDGPVSELRLAGFAISLVLWLLSFNGPLAVFAHRLFALHQADHLVLRLLAPFLFVLANPWPVLAAGAPRLVRRWAQVPSRVFAVLPRLPVALALLIVWFYLWQLPAFHNAVIGNPAMTLLAHLGMAATGLNFFTCVLDQRDSPKAHLQAPRLLAATIVILSNILLGSLTTLKETVLYTGYDVPERLWGFAPLADETIGGYTIWVPSSMVVIVAVLFIVTGWNAAELRHWERRHTLIKQSNSAALEFPETAQELRLKAVAPNRQMAGALALTSISIFLIVMVTVVAIVTLR